MQTLLPSICVWIPIVLNSDLPKNATLGGYFYDSDTAKTYHLYVARTWKYGELVPIRQVNARYSFAIIFRRGSNEPITAERSKKNDRGEILTCDNKSAQLRWMKYQPTMGLESCVPYGTVNSGEIGYVGRTSARQTSDPKTYGSIPGLFVPSDGFISVYLGGLIHSTDVEVLCVK